MDKKLLKLWNSCEVKRQFIISKMYNSEINGNEASVLYNQILSACANIICDIQNEINDLIEEQSKIKEMIK